MRKRVRRPASNVEKAWGRIQEALVNLRGDPRFEEYVESIRLLKEESVLDNCHHEVVRDHNAMAFNAGVIYACVRIIETVEPAPQD